MLRALVKTLWLWGCIGASFYTVALIQPDNPPARVLCALILVGGWIIGGGMSTLHDLDDEGL